MNADERREVVCGFKPRKDEVGAKDISPVSCGDAVCECRGDPLWSPGPEKSKSQIFCLAFFILQIVAGKCLCHRRFVRAHK